MERLRDQFFRGTRAIGVGSVDEVYAQFNGASQCGEGSGVVGRRTPNTFACDAHGPITKAVNDEIAANGERSGGRCGNSMRSAH